MITENLGQRSIQRAFLTCACCACFFFISCGGGGAPKPTVIVSKVADRVFVSNQQTNVLQIVDGQRDKVTTFTVPTGAGPSLLLEVQSKQSTIVYNSAEHSIGTVDNATEHQSASVSLPGDAVSVAITADGATAYAAIPASNCSGSTIVGAIAVVTFSSTSITGCVPLQGVRNIVLGHNGATLLAFVDNSNTAYYVTASDLTTGAVAISDAGAVLDHPANAVFSGDDSTAYILSCGEECGGAAGSAKVTVFTPSSKTLGSSASVAAAREGLLSGTKLYVAGTVPPVSPGGSPQGTVEPVDTATLTAGASAVISDGIHETIALGSNNQLFIGARACSNVVHGCLSIYNTSTGAVAFSAPVTAPAGDDVTGIEPIPGRNVVYVCEGGELRIYDTTTAALTANQSDIIGKAVDVRAIF